MIYWLCVVLLLSLSIHERRSRNPCAVLADTRRASTFVHLRALRRSVTLRRINVLARPIQFSKNRPRLAARHPSDCSPRLVGVPNRHFDRVQGNLPTLLRPLRAVNTFFSVAAISRTSAKAAAGIGCWKPSVVVSDLGAREAGNLGTAAVSERRAAINERRRRNPILRAGGGLVNPDYHCLRAILLSPVAVNPGARHVTTASHTAGQPPRE